MVAFTQRRKPDIRIKQAYVFITVRGHILGFNKEATTWLEVYLD